jgi:hypothetical protein
MNFLNYYKLFTEGLSRSIIVVDVQPAYSGIYDGDENPIFEKIINFCQRSSGKILMFVNAEEDQLTTDTIEDIKIYWEDSGFDDWNRVEIVDKGYGFLRGWMDNQVSDRSIIKALREMYRLRISDSREIVDSFDEVDSQEKWKETLNDPNIPSHDPLYVFPKSIRKLKEYQNSLLVGGGRNECLREVELIMNAFNIKYKRVDDLIYG